MSDFEYSDLIDLHIEKLGVAPVITGINWNTPNLIIEGIDNAIETGVPYVEDEPPEGDDL